MTSPLIPNGERSAGQPSQRSGIYGPGNPRRVVTFGHDYGDFDFRNRHQTNKPQYALLNRLHSNFSRSVDSLRKGLVNMKSSDNSTESVDELPTQFIQKFQIEMPKAFDPLPTDRQNLEIRANYHLGEMGRIRIMIKIYNDTIHETKYKLDQCTDRYGEDMSMSTAMLDRLIQYTRETRDGLQMFVEYHRKALHRIADKRDEVDRAEGVPELVAGDRYRAMEKEEAWFNLFAV